MKELYDKVSTKCSYLATQSYSTSFSLAIKCLDPKLRNPICAIYGFVRFADEIVDTFHDYDKPQLLDRFEKDTYLAIEEGISLNPILNSFQHAVNKYNIDRKLIEQFLYSMRMDLTKTNHNMDSFETYILGSAEVVGLMCLKVFCEGDQAEYDRLKPYAMKLGSAFQKINFLRDLRDDYQHMGRTYFPGLNMEQFDEISKAEIEKSIESDFKMGFKGIKQLPRSARFGVYLAYVYYYALFNKIRRTPSSNVMEKRIRIPNQKKFSILFYTYLKHRLNLI
ncbi:phytoene/squalene synthase family protein [Fulvivirga kasyanovii]|uniref:Phytoene/squalene synthase family protein n=1 Tax=Fulvivirga kasyanovii TaxID=396812 RepID=A0ABW9RU41_9BACT|nr:phytoene/squalene synthase family protein [Fulvivirga kasyanovii]MTI27729.1 phytoene/squalene synthase family protein [Fulvivirga kasyanovii]